MTADDRAEALATALEGFVLVGWDAQPKKIVRDAAALLRHQAETIDGLRRWLKAHLPDDEEVHFLAPEDVMAELDRLAQGKEK